MEILLYVYDLSKGLARSMSRQFLGVQIDAVYHTSLVFGGVEYFIGGGVQTCYPGTTHHGRPMEIISMGQTTLPLDVILEYLESLKEIYTAESYDLFAHNCNNFTNDFAMFLVGKGIPKHITSLPETVLRTPFGQMLRPQIENAMRPVVQAPPPAQSVVVNKGVRNGAGPTLNGSSKPSSGTQRKVHNIESQQGLDKLLENAETSCAVIFFTSATCSTCKVMYPLYDELSEETKDKVTLIKIDITKAHTVAAKYSIRVTPTFITFLKGKQDDMWTGANPADLREKIRMLVQAAFPLHPHEQLKLPTFLRTSPQPVTYARVPPMEKLVTKMGVSGQDPVVTATIGFINARESAGAQEAPLPDLVSLGGFLQKSVASLPPDNLFVAYDLFRAALVDPRVSSFFAEEQDHQTLITLLEHVSNMASCPYNLRLVTIHTACNSFTSPLFAKSVLSNPLLAAAFVDLATNNILEPASSMLRPAAVALALDLATAEFHHRTAAASISSGTTECIPQALQSELCAALIEALSSKLSDKPDVVRAMAIALARLVYKAPMDGDVISLCQVMEAANVILVKEKEFRGEDQTLLNEIGHELLGRGVAT